MLKFVPVLADKKESFDTLYESMKEGLSQSRSPTRWFYLLQPKNVLKRRRWPHETSGVNLGSS